MYIPKAIIVVSFILFVCILGMGMASASSPESKVRNGRLSFCQKKTVDELFDNFIGSPVWSSVSRDESHSLVTLKGDIFYFNKPSKVALNFLVDTKSGRFNFETIEINGQQESNFMATGIFLKQCAK